MKKNSVSVENIKLGPIFEKSRRTLISVLGFANFRIEISFRKTRISVFRVFGTLRTKKAAKI